MLLEFVLLENAKIFLDNLEIKTKEKVIYNIDKATGTNDAELLKKINDDIWEFRTLYNGLQIRLLTFWDKIKKYLN